jgi:hypothetical protein
MTLADDVRVTAAAHVRYRQFDDELIVLDLGGGEYFALNATGARMWHALIAGKSPAEVAVDLAGAYDIDPSVLLGDCLSLADDLLGRGLLERRPA